MESVHFYCDTQQVNKVYVFPRLLLARGIESEDIDNNPNNLFVWTHALTCMFT